MRILIVESREQARRTYTAALRPLNKEVVGVDNGADALAVALSDPPALIIAATNLARVDGWSLCAFLRREPVTRDTPIVLVRSSEIADDLPREADAAPDAVLESPCDSRTLLAQARWCLESPAGDGPPVADATASGPTQEPQSTGPRDHVRAHHRLSRPGPRGRTRTPLTPVPPLQCPECTRPMAYVESYVGGVERTPEQWDTFECESCGRFEYRQRLRKLRRAL